MWLDWLLLLLLLGLVLPRLLASALNSVLPRYCNHLFHFQCDWISLRSLGGIIVTINTVSLSSHITASLRLELASIQFKPKLNKFLNIQISGLKCNFTLDTNHKDQSGDNLVNKQRNSPRNVSAEELKNPLKYDFKGNWLVAHVIDAVLKSFSLHLVDLTVNLIKNRTQLSAELHDLYIFISSESTVRAARNLNAQLGKFLIKLDPNSTATAMNRNNHLVEENDNSLNSNPLTGTDIYTVRPILELSSVKLSIEIPLEHQMIPNGIFAVELSLFALDIHLDPVRQLRYLSNLCLEYCWIIQSLQKQTAQQPKPTSFTPKQRDTVLRFIPKLFKLNFSRIQLQCVERENEAVDEALWSLLPRVIQLDLEAMKEADKFYSTSILNRSSRKLDESIEPIIHCFELRLNHLTCFCAMKTKYPIANIQGFSTHFLEVMEENSISSIDWSLQLAGPSLYFSGQIHPIIDGELLKFNGQVAPYHITVPNNSNISSSPASSNSSSTRPSANSSPVIPLVSLYSNEILQEALYHTSLFHSSTDANPQVIHSFNANLKGVRVDVYPLIAQHSNTIYNHALNIHELINDYILAHEQPIEAGNSRDSKELQLVKHHINVKVKIVDLQLALYPHNNDITPLCHLTFAESIIHLDNTPLQQHSQQLNCINYHTKVMFSLTGLLGSLPRELHNQHNNSQASANELFAVPGRFCELRSATAHIQSNNPDILLNAEGFQLKYEAQIMELIPHVVKLIIIALPRRVINKSSNCTKSQPSAAPDNAVEPSLCNLKCNVNNIRVDFPYILQFGDSALNEYYEALGQVPNPSISSSSHNTNNLSATSVMKFFSALKQAAEQQFSNPLSAQAAKHPSSATQGKPGLFRYSGHNISVSVDLLTSCWSISLFQSRCLHQDKQFALIETANLTSNNKTAKRCKYMEVLAHNADIHWQPDLQLALYKLIKDIVAAAINLKYGLFGLDGQSMNVLIGTNMCPVLDYNNDATLQLLYKNKKRYIDSFRLWYHHARARYLAEPFMHVSLTATEINLKMTINRSETLKCFIHVDQFSSNVLPYHFAFDGVQLEFMNYPLVSVKKVEMKRIGLPAVFEVDFTEEQHLLGEYLDLELSMNDVRLELVQQMELGRLLEHILLKVQALVMAIWNLPTLNCLSIMNGGPGYVGKPAIPPPAVYFTVQSLQLQLIDQPLESFLQQMYSLWLEERSEQERRAAILKLKLAAINPDPAAAKALHHKLMEWNSRSYIHKVHKLKRNLTAQDNGNTLIKAPLLLLSIDTFAMESSLVGELGRIRAASRAQQSSPSSLSCSNCSNCFCLCYRLFL
jgi:hypothetical protein